jgi:serine protease SohB
MSKEFKTSIESLNRHYLSQISDKSRRKAIKLKHKATTERAFVIRFNSKDGEAAFTKFEHDVNVVILNSEPKRKDKVYLVIHSPGGGVTAYANAAQQIKRLRNHGLEVTGFIDEIAASGGYMMAAVCNKIVAQPFAFVGSIGVVSQVPIFETLLTKLGVDVRTYTAGTHKRTVVPTKLPDASSEAAFTDKLAEIHTAFKNHILEYRPTINVDKLMEGDFYLAKNVIKEELVDVEGDSNTYILNAFVNGVDIMEVKTSMKKKGGGLSKLFGVDNVLDSLIEKVSAKIAASITFDRFIK